LVKITLLFFLEIALQIVKMLHSFLNHVEMMKDEL